MQIEKKVYQLTEQKREKFLVYETATLELLQSSSDSAEQYITRRGELANEIDAISEEIGRLCDGLPNGRLVLQASLAAVSYEQLPPELHALFDAGQATRSVVYRITQADKRVVEYLSDFRDSALDKIKRNQHMPKIKKYLTDLGGGQQVSSLTNEKA